MKHGGKMLVCMVSGLAVCSVNAVTTETQDNPYQSIIDRNVFSLKPAPPPVDPAEANKPTALKITLTGITTILGNKRVLMKTAPPPAKAGESPKTEKSYILTEGEREGDIEVIEIDEKIGSVKVNNAGTVQTLTFEKDGAKLPATPPPAAAPVPGAAPIPGLPVAKPPGAQPPATPGTTPSFQLPTRIPRLPAAGGQAAVGNAGLALPGAQSAPAYGNPGVVLPGNANLALQGGAVPGQTAAPPPGTTPVPQYSLEEQAILIEANRQAGGPGASLLPPTLLTPHPGATTPAQNPTVPSLPIPGRPGQY